MSTRPENPGTTQTGEPGVLHDIGYRHYDGARLGSAAVARALFADSLRGAYGLGRSARAKVVPAFVVAVMCLPALIIAVVVSLAHLKSVPTGYTAYLVDLQVVVTVFVGAQAPASVSRDLRFRVVTLYFSRPLQRAAYVRAKFAAMAVAVFALLAAPLTILFAGALLAQLSFSDQAPRYLRSLVGAALLALLLAGLSLLLAAATPRRGLGVSAIVSVLLVLAGVQTYVLAIAASKGVTAVQQWSGLLSPFTLVDGITTRLMGGSPVLPDGGASAASGAVFALVAVAIVVACYAALLARYRSVTVT